MPELKMWTLDPRSGLLGGADESAWAAIATPLLDARQASAARAPTKKVRTLTSCPPETLPAAACPRPPPFPFQLGIACLPPKLTPTSSQHHLGAQAEVPGRPAGVQGVGPGVEDPAGEALVKTREGPGRHRQPCLGRVIRLGAEAGEGGQDPERPAGVVVGPFEIELDHLSTRAPTRVADGDQHRQVLARSEGGAPGRQRLVAPVGIAQAMAEAEKWLHPPPAVTAVTDQQALGVGELARLRLGVEHR